MASRRDAALRVVAASYPLSALLVLVAAPWVPGHVTSAGLLWGAVAGVVNGVAVWWFYLALARGPMSIVSPATAVLVAAVPLVVGLASGESLTVLAVVGIALASVAVVLVSYESDETIVGEGHPRFTRSVALLTVGGGVAFGVMFVALHRVPDGAGLWPIVASRVAASAVVLLVAAGARQLRAPARAVRPHIVVVAVLDVVANAVMLWALAGDDLATVSVVGSLYPAATVVPAVLVLGEHLSRSRAAGLVLAAVAVSLIAVAG